MDEPVFSVGNIYESYRTLATERAVLVRALQSHRIADMQFRATRLEPLRYSNDVDQAQIGLFRRATAMKSITADAEILSYFTDQGMTAPGYFEAGPREQLYFKPRDVRIGIVTPGGIAPGLNTVVHCLINMHETYGMRNRAYGFTGGFRGIAREEYRELTTADTILWIHRGGTELGTSRDSFDTDRLVRALCDKKVNILYVVGGDGSLTCAHDMAKYIRENDIKVAGKSIVVAGVPKTMDNDILWVWHSFGFDTAVEEATRVVNAIHDDAKSTERVCIVQLFGRDAGFVAAHAALASGQVHTVLVPEVAFSIGFVLDHIEEVVSHEGFGLVVVAEGAAPLEYSDEWVHERLREDGFDAADPTYRSHPEVSARLGRGKLDFLVEGFVKRFANFHAGRHRVFVCEPRHLIRAVPPNSVDQIYCQRLADLAVHNALAGFTDFMISQWLTEYVLVPLALVAEEKDPTDTRRLTKKIPPHGIFWTTVTSSTRQPSFESRE